MISFKQLLEAKDAGGHGSEKHHVMSFARMNPPTTGHMEVINKLHAVAKEHNAPHSLIVSHSQDAKKNPLTGEQKIKHIKRYSPETNVKASSKESPTILHHAAELHKQGVQHLHVVAGSDRHKEMHDLLHKYNTGEEHKHGSFKFKSITMHSSGDRDPDSEGTSGMSGTKMREHAHAGNFKEFRKGVPSHVSDKHAHELMKDVRHGSGIKEEAISYKTFMEARMSAAVKLQRAFEREQQKSAASRQRAQELLQPKKPEPVKEEALDERIVKVEGGYEVKSEHGNKNLGKSPTLAGAKKRLGQIEYFKHVKEDMQFEDFDSQNLAKQDLSNKKNKGGIRGHIIAALKRKAGLDESVHDNRTGFAKRKREDDEYHNGGDLHRHVYKYNVSKPGINDGKKHERHVTTPLTTRPKHELEHLARAHLTKQGYQIHEETDSRGPYKQKSPVVIAPKDPKAKTYGKIVSKLRPVAEERVSKHKDLGATKNTKHFVKNVTTGEVISPHRTRADANEGLRAAEADGEHGHKFKIVRAVHEEVISEGSYEKAEENKKSADSAKKQGDMFAHHLHMADHHDNLSQWHGEKGRYGEADRHAAKAEEHHEKAMSLKEEAQIDEAMSPQKQMDFDRMMKGAMSRAAYNAKWKKPLKSDAKVIYGKNVKEETELTESHVEFRLDHRDKVTGDHKPTFADHEAKVSDTTDKATYVKVPSHKADSFKRTMKSKHGVTVELAESYDINENETQENKMGLKSFMTLVKEGTLQSSGDDSIPTLTKAPVAPTLDRKYIKGTPENKALKASRKPINGHPTGKYNEEVEQIEEALDPSEIASNPRMYSADSAKKAYYHKKATPEDKKSLERHLDRHHGGTSWRKPVKEETEQIEEAVATVKSQKYSWGTMKTVHHGASFSVPLHPEHHQAIHALKDQQEHKFKDETGRHWTAKRDGEHVHLHSANDGPKTTVKHSDLKEEVELDEKFINGREYASHGLMHPDHAKMEIHKKTGHNVDFYAHGTGDKISGKVTKNDGKEVHIQADKTSGGKTHKFKVTPHLPKQQNEEVQIDEVADMTPATPTKPTAPKNKKPAVNSDMVNAAGQEPHEETFEKAPKPVRKEGFSVADLFQALKEGMWPGSPEYKAKFDGAKQGGGSGIKKGSRYGGSLQKDEPDHDEDDAPAKAGRKVGSKSGARKNLGNSKLHK